MLSSNIKWLYNRLSIMGPGEILYRGRQALQKYKQRARPRVPLYKSFSVIPLHLDIESLKDYEIEDTTEYRFFGLTININRPIDFNKDISSGKSFPIVFSKDIDTRTGKYGDAKVVWEINRLQFLLPIILKYKKTGDGKYLDRFVAIMEDWNRQNPYLQGVNWYSNIEVNIRLINWYWCWVLLSDDKLWKANKKYKVFRDEIWVPLVYRHCCYSYENPSHYSSANNHLIAEYAGLFIASTLWKFPETGVWLKHAKKGLEKEIILQHSANGVNREEAAEYIQFITDFFLLAYITGQHHGITFSDGYKNMLVNICTYIFNFLDVKGNFPRYGDEDDGKIVIPSGDAHENNFISILNTAAILFNIPAFKSSDRIVPDIKSALLTSHINGSTAWQNILPQNQDKQTVFYNKEGHFIFRKTAGQNEIYLHFDAAPLGFLSIAAHGHADALSVILHVDGCPFIVDPGTYTYYADAAWRNYFVSTPAHNTITVDGKNQAKHAGAMMWLQHYKVKILEVHKDNKTERAAATHNGYNDIGCKHTRTVEFNREEEKIIITDFLETCGGGEHEIYMPWHLHPGVHAKKNDNSGWKLTNKECNRDVTIYLPQSLEWKLSAASLNPVNAWYSKSFLQKQVSYVIAGRIKISESTTFTTVIKINEYHP